MLSGRQLRAGKKGGSGVGLNKRGKGCRIVAIVTSQSLPVSLLVSHGRPHEVRSMETCLLAALTQSRPARLVADKAYAGLAYERRLAELGTRLLTPPHPCSKRAPLDEAGLACYKKRWAVERFFAWMQLFRRLVTRYEQKMENFLAMAQLAASMILLKTGFHL